MDELGDMPRINAVRPMYDSSSSLEDKMEWLDSGGECSKRPWSHAKVINGSGQAPIGRAVASVDFSPVLQKADRARSVSPVADKGKAAQAVP